MDDYLGLKEFSQ